MTINSTEMPVLTAQQIRKAELDFSLPFMMRLSNKTVFKSERVVRHIPRRRMVVFGTWCNKPVVAKLFFDRYRASQQMESDVRGVNTLREHRIPTPALLFEGADEADTIKALLFELIPHSKNLDEIWQAQAHPDDVFEALKAVTVELATQHVFGIVQHDLHLKNFLLTDKVTYTLDGAQVELNDPILPKKQSMQSMALFLSQLGVGYEELQIQLYEYYANARGWSLKPNDINELMLEIKGINDNRWRRYARKIFRDCTQYKRIHTFKMKGMYDRAYSGHEFQEFLRNPDSVFQSASAQMIKNGRSSTVIQIKIDGSSFVIKRYNMKNLIHRLRRMFRQTRAAKSWRLANKLSLFGIQTAKPVAYIESNILGLRGRSYYVTESVTGTEILSTLREKLQHGESIQTIIEQTVDLLRNLVRVGLTHGDLKASNILIDKTGKPVIIDLDGAAEHISLSGLRRSWKNEIERFLRNFDTMPEIRQLFQKQL